MCLAPAEQGHLGKMHSAPRLVAPPESQDKGQRDIPTSHPRYYTSPSSLAKSVTNKSLPRIQPLPRSNAIGDQGEKKMWYLRHCISLMTNGGTTDVSNSLKVRQSGNEASTHRVIPENSISDAVSPKQTVAIAFAHVTQKLYLSA